MAGQNVTTIGHMIHDAFAEPFALDQMIRITLVTGAGKLGRQKYDENAAKAVTTALREAGFDEDRAASCVIECAGTFKLQHDTGKNLKTVVVFPKVHNANQTNANNNNPTAVNGKENVSGAMSSMSLNGSTSPLVPGLTAEQYKALTTSSSKTVFEKMMESKCPSWVQKRQCLQFLDQIKQQVEELDQRLCKGTVLTDTEQTFYDTVSTPAIEEKQTIIKDQMHHLVEKGQITLEEKRLLLSQVSERIDHLTKEEATHAGNKARLEKIQALKTKALERKALLDKTTSQPPHGLRHEAEIRKLRKELQPLLELEATTKGRLLSIKETQTLARKDEILQEITQLEVRWFYVIICGSHCSFDPWLTIMFSNFCHTHVESLFFVCSSTPHLLSICRILPEGGLKMTLSLRLACKLVEPPGWLLRNKPIRKSPHHRHQRRHQRRLDPVLLQTRGPPNQLHGLLPNPQQQLLPRASLPKVVAVCLPP